jgi:hypothetical protein
MIPILIPAALGLIGGYLSREPKKYHLGGDMSKHLAPNGKPSKLTHEQWHLVRTPQFKAWFGDWENDPENASKVVDENGEPLVVYRGTRNNIQNVSGFWLTKSKQYAEGFGEVNEYFVKILNPMSEEEFNKTWMVDFTKYDGRLGDFHKIVVKDIIQIKLADGSNTTFEANNPDIRYEDGGFIGTWSELQKVNPNLWETGIFRRTLNPMGATDIIPKDVHIRQGQWQNYGQYDEIEAETIYGEPDNYGYYNDEDGNPISDEITGNYIKDEWDYENDTEIKAIISNKQLRNNLIDSFKTQQGKEYLKKVIASLPKNADGTITAYRIGTIGGGAQSYTLSERMAKTFSNQGTDIMPSGLPSIPKEGYKDYGVLPVNKVRINPKGIVAWSPYDSEILVEPKYVILEISN